MDGHEVARAIAPDASLSATTLVALTGYAAPEDLARSQEAGFDYHLAKPPSIEAIEQVLAQAMRRTGKPPVARVANLWPATCVNRSRTILMSREHRRADEALRASEARFRSVLENSRMSSIESMCKPATTITSALPWKPSLVSRLMN